MNKNIQIWKRNYESNKDKKFFYMFGYLLKHNIESNKKLFKKFAKHVFSIFKENKKAK